MTVGLLALFVALGGTGFAASQQGSTQKLCKSLRDEAKSLVATAPQGERKGFREEAADDRDIAQILAQVARFGC
jgi:hypothetical protein